MGSGKGNQKRVNSVNMSTSPTNNPSEKNNINPILTTITNNEIKATVSKSSKFHDRLHFSLSNPNGNFKMTGELSMSRNYARKNNLKFSNPSFFIESPEGKVSHFEISPKNLRDVALLGLTNPNGTIRNMKLLGTQDEELFWYATIHDDKAQLFLSAFADRGNISLITMTVQEMNDINKTLADLLKLSNNFILDLLDQARIERIKKMNDHNINF